jgi:hypothetical protein
MPSGFERNEGQAAAAVRFVGRTRTYQVELQSDGTVLYKTAGGDDIRTRWAGGASNPRPFERNPLSLRFNEYRGDDPSRWRADVRLFQSVGFQDLYPGIDISYQIVAGELAYILEAHPGANLRAIRMEVADGWGASVNSSGDLELTRDGRMLRHRRPIAHQILGGRLSYVDVEFLASGNVIELRLGAYAAGASLVIAPDVKFSSQLGGTNWDGAYAITSDGSGNLYITGETGSSDFPSARPGRMGNDVFLTKMKGGVILYTTILASRGNDAGRAIVVDAAGNAYVTGTAGAGDFPATAGVAQGSLRGGQDAFLARVDPSGRLLSSTYLGGGGDDTGTAVALNSSGDIHLAGYTVSPDFPVSSGSPQRTYGGGAHDVFLAKLNAAGTQLLYCTLLGGNGNDTASGLAVDRAGNAVVVGSTDSRDLPASAAIQPQSRGNSETLIASLNPAGTRWNFVTYFGGSSTDLANAVALGNSGDIYVTGTSSSVDFPVSASAHQHFLRGGYDVFVTHLTATGALVYSTLLGGSDSDNGTSIVVDASGQAWIGGYTSSVDLPLVRALQSANKGNFDAFVAQFDATGSTLLFATYWGGALDDRISGLAFGSSGRLLATGMTASPDFPSVGAAPSGSGGYNAFVTEFDPLSVAVASMISPLPGTTLGVDQTFSWTAIPGAAAYWLDVGSSVGTGDYYASSTSGTTLSAPRLPCTGADIYVQLWTNVGGAWQQPRRYRYTATPRCAAAMIQPAPGSALTTAVATFKWTSVSGADAYWLDVGSVVGQGDYFATSAAGTTLTVSSLPCKGQPVHVQLWTHISGRWQPPERYAYTAAVGCSAALIIPADGASLSNSAVTFVWSPILEADLYWLDVGSTPGVGDYLALATSFTGVTVRGLPCDSRLLYAQLWTHVGTSWRGPERYTFRAWGACGQLTTPAPGSTLSQSAVTFTWKAGTGVTAYWLDVGTQIGQGNIFAANVGTATSKAVTAIPTNGLPLYVQLWSLIDGTWYLNRYTYVPFQ